MRVGHKWAIYLLTVVRNPELRLREQRGSHMRHTFSRSKHLWNPCKELMNWGGQGWAGASARGPLPWALEARLSSGDEVGSSEGKGSTPP